MVRLQFPACAPVESRRMVSAEKYPLLTFMAIEML